jgi:hypothetical protein
MQSGSLYRGEFIRGKTGRTSMLGSTAGSLPASHISKPSRATHRDQALPLFSPARKAGVVNYACWQLHHFGAENPCTDREATAKLLLLPSTFSTLLQKSR